MKIRSCLCAVLLAGSCHAGTFPEALEQMQAGGKMTRTAWTDTFAYKLGGASVSVSRPPLLGPFQYGQHIHQLPRYEICTVVGSLLICEPYMPVGEDMRATDWEPFVL